MINQGSDIRQILQWEREMERQKKQIKTKQNKNGGTKWGRQLTDK